MGFGHLEKLLIRFPHNFWRHRIGPENLFFGRTRLPRPGEDDDQGADYAGADSKVDNADGDGGGGGGSGENINGGSGENDDDNGMTDDDGNGGDIEEKEVISASKMMTDNEDIDFGAATAVVAIAGALPTTANGTTDYGKAATVSKEALSAETAETAVAAAVAAAQDAAVKALRMGEEGEEEAEGRGDFFWFVDLSDVTGSPCLLAILPAEAAKRVNDSSDESTVLRCVHALERMFNVEDESAAKRGGAVRPKEVTFKVPFKVPSPVAWRVSHWGRDPYSRGSYSYLAVGSTPSDIDELRADVNGQIFFAGEACSREYPSMVHGAYLSGVDAARKVESSLRPVKRHPDILLTLSPSATNGGGAVAAASNNGSSGREKATPRPSSSLFVVGGDARVRGMRVNCGSEAKVCCFCARSKRDDDIDGEGESAGGATTTGKFVGPFLDAGSSGGGGGSGGGSSIDAAASSSLSLFWAHENCAAFSPEVSQDNDSNWCDVTRAMRRGRKMACSHCSKKGATVGCVHGSCRRSFHARCATLFTGWAFERADMGKHYYCVQHRAGAVLASRKNPRAGGAAAAVAAASAVATATSLAQSPSSSGVKNDDGDEDDDDADDEEYVESRALKANKRVRVLSSSSSSSMPASSVSLSPDSLPAMVAPVLVSGAVGFPGRAAFANMAANSEGGSLCSDYSEAEAAAASEAIPDTVTRTAAVAELATGATPAVSLNPAQALSSPLSSSPPPPPQSPPAQASLAAPLLPAPPTQMVGAPPSLLPVAAAASPPRPLSGLRHSLLKWSSAPKPDLPRS